MRIYINQLIGNKFILKVNNNDTILDIKLQIHMNKGILWSNQKLLYNGFILENNNKLQFYNICNNDVILLIYKDIEDS